ncbi:MAG: zinc ribbon domain-containing protein [Salinibacter sp.]
MVQVEDGKRQILAGKGPLSLLTPRPAPRALPSRTTPRPTGPYQDSRGTAPVCGHEEKANRKKYAEFECQSCGHEEHADVVGARNVARGAARQPVRE